MRRGHRARVLQPSQGQPQGDGAQGNCSAAPPAVADPPLIALSLGQCVLLTRGTALTIERYAYETVENAPALWLSNVYVRRVAMRASARVPQRDYSALVGVLTPNAAVYVTNTVFQGGTGMLIQALLVGNEARGVLVAGALLSGACGLVPQPRAGACFGPPHGQVCRARRERDLS